MARRQDALTLSTDSTIYFCEDHFNNISVSQDCRYKQREYQDNLTMNLQTNPISDPIKVILINPIVPAGQLIAVKILSGNIFSCNQTVDLTLLVYCNEKPLAQSFKLELLKCSFSCTNSIEVTSDLPRITDYDVFCFITNLKNPNSIELVEVKPGEDQFDTLYLLLKVANNLRGPIPEEKPIDDAYKADKKRRELKKKRIKPIFITDGLVAIDVLKIVSIDMPNDVFFCPSPLPTIAKTVLGEYLKVNCKEINDSFVWAANDETFHVEFEKPFLIRDKVDDSDGPNGAHCSWSMIRKETLDSINLDHTQFSPSWMKKEFIDKMASVATKNPYGCIYRANEFARTLRYIWMSRSTDSVEKIFKSIGVISDGSVGTLKGYPYVLPLVLDGESWTVDKRFENNTHVIAEIKRINKSVKYQHDQLLRYTKKFLQDNVIHQIFVPEED